jgi:hypothetical protein
MCQVCVAPPPAKTAASVSVQHAIKYNKQKCKCEQVASDWRRARGTCVTVWLGSHVTSVESSPLSSLSNSVSCCLTVFL